MPNNDDTTTKLGIDVGEFKRGIQDAQRQIKLANAEFKAASASMDKWSDSTEGVQAKIKQLESVLDAENKKLTVQKQRLIEVEREQGKNSAAADEMRIAIANQQASIAKTEKSLGYFNNKLSDLNKAENEAKTATGQLTTTINAQQKELDALKQKYANVVVEQGKNSKEAKALGAQISALSGDLAKNKNTLKDAETAADDFDNSLKDVKSDSSELSDGFTVMKGALSNLVASGIKLCIQGLKNLGSAAKDAFKEFDEGADNVIKATGATGEAAKELTKSYANVAKNVVGDLGDMGNALGEVNTRFGFTGDELEKATTKFVKFADITGTDAINAVKLVSRAMGDAGIKSEEYESVLDDLAIAAQASGISIDKLTENLTKYGAPMRALGFDTKEAIAIFSQWEKAGVNTEIAFSGMKQAIGKWSKEGKNAKEEFTKVLDEIGKAPDIASATTKAIEVFGQKAGPDLADAIKGGRFEFTEFMDILEGSKGTVEKTFNETQDASDKVKLAFQNMKVAAGEAVDELLRKYGPKIEKGLNDFVPKIKKFAKTFSTNVLPVLEKFYKVAKTVVTFITKNFSKIAPIVMTAVTAFTAFNAVMAVSKTVTAVTTALSGLTAGVGLATKAQVVYNAALSSNPIGAVIMAIAALTAAIIALASIETEAQKAHKAEMATLEETRNEIDANVASWNSLKDAQQKQIDGGMTEMSYLQSLKKELQSITDANGKVKKGYEERADFIISQLSEALDTEITKTDDVIDNYDEMIKAIDDLMEKKKAQIILDSQESLYAEAINNQSQALKDFNEIQDVYIEKKKEFDALNEQHDYWQKILDEEKLKGVTDLYAEAANNLYDIEEAQKLVNEEFYTAEENYTKQKNLISEYAYNIGVYEENMALAHAGRYDEMTTVNWNYVKDYQNASDAQKKMLEDQLAAEETNLALLQELKAKSGSDIYDQQIKQSEERIAQLKGEMKQYVDTTKDGLDKTKVVWSEGLDDQLSELTGHDIQFKHVGGGLIQMYIDGVAEGKPKSKETMAEIATEAINEISMQETHAKEAGEDLIDGVNNGIANEKKQSGVFSTIANFGTKLLGKLRSSLKEHSPSKATDEMGQFLVEGLPIGMKKKENEALKEVSLFGNNIIDTLNSELNQGTIFDSLIDTIKEKLIGIGEIIRDTINDAFKDTFNDANVQWGINRKLISATAKDMTQAVTSQGVTNTMGSNITYYYTQNNNSPKALSRLEIYRQTKNQLNFATGV